MADQTGTSIGVPGEHTGPFPPFDKQTFPSQLFWLTLAFATLYLLMSRMALPRIESILAQRHQRIDADISEAQRFKGESDEAVATYETRLVDARSRSQALINDARLAQVAEAEAQRKQRDASLNARIREAEKGITQAKSAAMTNVRGIATEAAAAIVERLSGKVPASLDGIAAAVADVLKR